MSFKQKVDEILASIDGKVISSPKLITRFGNERIFEVLIENKRTSGIVDIFKVNYSSKAGVVIKEDMFIHIEGDIRTVGKPKQSTYVVGCIIYAKTIFILDSEPDTYVNNVVLNDVQLYKFKNVRKSYSDNNIDVADYIVSVHRGHNRFSYFKASSFGEGAIFIGNVHNSVENVSIKCRLCSNKRSLENSDKYIFYLAVYYLDVKFKDKK